MRRITAAVVGLVAGLVVIAGLALTAGTASAAEKPHAKPIHLTCDQATDQASGSITCTWNAYDGASAYQVGITYKNCHQKTVDTKRVTDTTITFPATQPGQYRMVVRALGSDGKAIARSNRAHVHVKRNHAKKHYPKKSKAA